jgi:hypothetical protein
MGNTNWQQVSLDFVTPVDGKVTIGCRLGYWAAVSKGKAYFDEVTIEEVQKFTQIGTHVRVVVDPEDAAVVRPQTFSS